MSDELILNVSFDNQTVTDATENWTLSGTPNVTYEQISGGSGYSLVTGSLGTPPTLVAVDQEAIYNEYTIDFNLYIKPSYTDTGWFSFFNLNTGLHYGGNYQARVYNGLTINLEVGSSTSAMVTIDSPTNRWIHITIISEYDSDTEAYTAYLYVDSVLRTYKQGTRLNGSPFAIGKKLVLFNRGGSSFFLPNTPGLAIDNLTVIAGIHVPNQTPAISLPNLSRVFQNFCTWISSQLSAVAKSGSYNDLSDKPTISTVNDGTLTIQKNGTNVTTFTANQSTAATANITVPVNTSDLVNDSGFITSSSLPTVNNGTLTIQKNGTDVTTFTANQSTNATANITVPTAVSELTNDSGYLTSSSNLDASKLTSGTVDIARLPQGALERLIKVANEAARYALTIADVQLGDTVQQLDTGIMYIVTDADHLDSAAGYTEYTAGTAASVPWSGVTGKPTFAAVATSGAYSDLTGTPTIPTVNNATLTIQQNGSNVATFTANASSDVTCNITVPTALESLASNSIAFHNSYPRCKYLGTSITDAQNTAIKNRTYDDLFIGDYWTINGVNWRIVAIDYYYNVGDTNFDKGNVIVMPDTVLYSAQMNTENTTAGAYAGSLMRTQNLNSARTIAQNAFGPHLANHRIFLANAVDASGPSSWAWYDSDGVELPNEVQIYGTRVWGSALKGFDVATQKQQFPLFALAPQFVNIRQTYWLQDVSSLSVSGNFANVSYHGYAATDNASNSHGVRPSVTLSYI